MSDPIYGCGWTYDMGRLVCVLPLGHTKYHRMAYTVDRTEDQAEIDRLYPLYGWDFGYSGGWHQSTSYDADQARQGDAEQRRRQLEQLMTRDAAAL